MTELEFHVARLAEIPEGDMLRVQIGNRHIALYKISGRVFATQAICTHGLALLTDGYLEGGMVECPMHGGSFDIASGAAMRAPCSIPLETYPVAIEDGEVRIGLQE